MKRCLIYLTAILLATPAFAEKLPSSLNLRVVKGHNFSFDKESLADSPYFPDTFSAGNKFSFDGENLVLTTKDGNTVKNIVKKFSKTENIEEKTWQYLITLDGSGNFPTVVEIKFLPNKDANVLFPLVDSTSGDLLGFLVSECKVIP